MRSLLRGERGSVLLLHLFLVLTIIAAIGVIADVGSVIGARQQLAATADQAAIAGAQAVDLDAYYTHGADSLTGVPLEPAAVHAAAQAFLAPAIAQQQQAGLALESVSVESGTVAVRLSCRAPLPFSSLLGLTSLPVTASARVRMLVQPPT